MSWCKKLLPRGQVATFLRDRPVVIFTNNEVVPGAAVASGSSRNIVSDDLLYAYARRDADLQSWYG